MDARDLKMLSLREELTERLIRDAGYTHELLDGMSTVQFDAVVRKVYPDQTAKADAGKLQLTLVPTGIIRAIAKIRMYGNQKYGSPDNWKEVSPERYWDAAYRHFLACVDDPKGVDPESGLSHLDHCACNLAFLIEMLEVGV